MEGTEAPEKGFGSPPRAPRRASRYVAPAPTLTQQQTEQLMNSQGVSGRPRKKPAGMRQGQLPVEIVSKGRVEKSEPTNHHREDLDVPTYIRRGGAVDRKSH